MNYKFNSIIGRMHKYLGNTHVSTDFFVKIRNQCDAIIHSHLNDGIDMNMNGEMWLIDKVAPNAKTFIDVGANTGAWSKAFLNKMKLPTKGILVEPSPIAFQTIISNLESEIKNNLLVVIQEAATESLGTMTFYMEENAGETSSLISKHSNFSAKKIIIPTTTIDTVMQRHQIDFIDILKIDAEGYDLNVMRGAEISLRNKSIGIIQFEYNQPWAYTSSTLAYAIDYLNKFDYKIYLLKKNGLYNFNYDHFGEYFGYSNFVAIAPDYLSVEPLSSL